MKQKESSGAVTVPGKTRDNGELNGVLNGKSSVFSHRFNVIAALTLLRSAILCCLPLLCLFTSVFWFVQLFFPFLSQPSLCLIIPLQGLRLSHIPWAVFRLMFTMDHLGLQYLSMCPHIIFFCKILGASLSRTSPLAS